MQIFYYSDKLRKNYEDEAFLTKKFGKDICKKFAEFLKHIIFSKNLLEAQNTKVGLKIKKLKGNDNVWSARLNKKYRVNFECQSLEIKKIKEIIIFKIHPHNQY